MAVISPQLNVLSPMLCDIETHEVQFDTVERLNHVATTLQKEYNPLINKPAVLVAQGNFFSMNTPRPAYKPRLCIDPDTGEKFDIPDKPGTLRSDTFLVFAPSQAGTMEHSWQLTMTTPRGEHHIHRLDVQGKYITGHHWGFDLQGIQRQSEELNNDQLNQLTTIIESILDAPQTHEAIQKYGQQQQHAEDDLAANFTRLSLSNHALDKSYLKRKKEAFTKAGFPLAHPFKPQDKAEYDPDNDENLKKLAAHAVQLAAAAMKNKV